MALIHKNFFSDDVINYICNLPIVIKTKQDLEISNLHSKHFSINITSEIQDILFEKLGLKLTNIPMRWIKGDTKPHIDYGKNKFNNTHLVYLTDSKGEFLIDKESYTIKKNTCYIFSENTRHETINTGSIPRLLLGPMSEIGDPVGINSINVDGQTETIYIKYNSTENINEYRINQDFWQQLYLPIVIFNTNSNPSNNILKIIFTTDIVLNNNFDFFICGSDGIQFGSTSLKEDGTRPKINIEDCPQYSGLIQNYERNNIYVFNLEVRSIGTTSLLTSSGWIGQESFGVRGKNNYIINCLSNGEIPPLCGGIVGGTSGYGDGETSASSTLYIIGCSSSGNIGENAGGMAGYNSGAEGGSISCEQCWSTGSIGTSGGGIFGQYTASGEAGFGGQAIATKCYSTGEISGENAGGIFGQLSGTSAMTTAQNCYSRGSISGTTAGGIYGNGAASDGGNSLAINCYSSGLIQNIINGIYSGGGTGEREIQNCYIADDTWVNSDANAALIGTPNPIVGNIWVSTGVNLPYELNMSGYTPYNLQNIIFQEGSPKLKNTYSQTISPGGTSIQGIYFDADYSILQITGGNISSYETISIDSFYGVISTTISTSPGNYTLYIRNILDRYNITSFNLTVSGNSQSTQTSFGVSDLFLANFTNTINLIESGGNLGYINNNNYFLVYDMFLSELVNNYLVNKNN